MVMPSGSDAATASHQWHHPMANWRCDAARQLSAECGHTAPRRQNANRRAKCDHQSHSPGKPGPYQRISKSRYVACPEWSEQSLGSWTYRRPCKFPLAISYRGSTGMVRREFTGGIARPGLCQRSIPMTDSSNRSAQLPTKCCCSMSGRTSQSTIDKATNPTNHHRHRTRSMAMTP